MASASARIALMHAASLCSSWNAEPWSSVWYIASRRMVMAVQWNAEM